VTRARLLLSACVGLAIVAAPARAADFNVTNTSDSGAGSLRTGVGDANALAGADRILFSGISSMQSISLLTPLPDIAQTLTIDGTTASSNLTIVGDGTTIVSVDPATTLTLIDVGLSNGDVALGSGSLLVLDVSAARTLDEVIRDASLGAAGRLEKRGSARLTLTGANAYTGGTLVSAGELEVAIASLPGDVTLASNTKLLFTDAADGTFAGVISGAGALVKNSSNTLTLAGANTFTGGTTINAGTLSASPDALKGAIAIGSGATLELLSTATHTYAGAISGAGQLRVAGGGLLILAPSAATPNSFASAHVTAMSTLRGTAAAIPGDVAIDVGSALAFDQSSSGTYAGTLSGAGGLEKIGSGTLTLTGNNAAFTGSVDVFAGTLVARTSALPVDTMVSAGALLAFDEPSDAVSTIVVGGAGDFEKRGGGTLELASAQTYTGATTVSAGRLDVTGGLASGSLSVAPSATLGGTGSIAGAVSNAGRIAPGTSIGTLPVDSVVFSNGSLFEVEVAPGGMNDRLAVTNAASLSGATLDLRVAPGSYTNQMATVLTAGSISGAFAFTDDFPLLDVSLATFANSVVVTIDSNGASFASAAASPSQLAVASVLDAELATASGDLLTVMQSFSTLTTSEFRAALDSLSGETLTQFATVRLAHANRLDRTLHGRMREASDAFGADRPRGEGLLLEAPAERAPFDLWIEPYASFSDIDARRGASDSDSRLLGGALGGEWRIHPRARIGAAFAYGHGDVDFAGHSATTTAHSYLGALYGGIAGERLRVGLSSRIGYSQMESDRDIAIGAIARRASADFDGLDAGARIEFAGKLVATQTWLLEPYASVAYTHLQRDAFRESGAGSVSLDVEREQLDSVLVGAGTRLRAAFQMEPDVWLLPEIYGEWQQEVGDRDRRIDARFAGQSTGAVLRVRGAELQRNGANAGVAWTVRTANGYEARAAYDLSLDVDRISHTIGLRVGTYW